MISEISPNTSPSLVLRAVMLCDAFIYELYFLSCLVFSRFSVNEGVIVLGATNKIENLDKYVFFLGLVHMSKDSLPLKIWHRN